MQFGEIIEPSTRALILDDDLEELPEYKAPAYEWVGIPQPPTDLESVIFIDSHKVVEICSNLCKNIQPVAQIAHEGLSIYKLEQYHLVVFNGNCKNFVIGELVDLLSLWIKEAKTIHCITNTPISTFQPSESLNKSSTIITFSRCLTNREKVPYGFCKRLEPPNLIQGFGASVFSYCLHSNIKASLWVVYTDNMPIDSVNSAEIVRLFGMFGLDVKVGFRVDTTASNLYM